MRISYDAGKYCVVYGTLVHTATVDPPFSEPLLSEVLLSEIRLYERIRIMEAGFLMHAKFFGYGIEWQFVGNVSSSRNIVYPTIKN